MKYKLIIDKNAEEEITAVVHSPSSLTEQIENMILNYSGDDFIMGYRDDEMRKLAFHIIFMYRETLFSSVFSNNYHLVAQIKVDLASSPLFADPPT